MSVTYAGYNCSVCGAWVASGTMHGCGGTPSYAKHPYSGADSGFAVAGAIHRLAAAVELLASIPKEED